MKIKTIIAVASITVLAFAGMDQAQAKTRHERKRIQSNSYKAQVKHRGHQPIRRQVVKHRPNSRRVVTRSHRRVVRPIYRRSVVRYRHVHSRPVQVISHEHVHYYGDDCYDDGSDIFWNLHIGSNGFGVYIGN